MHEKHMRPHLDACLIDGQMRHFPSKKREENKKGGGTGGVLYLQTT